MPNLGPSQRIKGQEVSLLVVRDGQLEDTLVDVQDFSLTPKFEIKEVGYLGEPTNRFDYIFNGVKGKMKLHLHKSVWFAFQQAQVDKAQRRTPDVVFNVTAVLFFPDGDQATALVPDVSWGEQPMNVASRGDYVSVEMDFSASDFVATTA